MFTIDTLRTINRQESDAIDAQDLSLIEQLHEIGLMVSKVMNGHVQLAIKRDYPDVSDMIVVTSAEDIQKHIKQGEIWEGYVIEGEKISGLRVEISDKGALTGPSVFDYVFPYQSTKELAPSPSVSNNGEDYLTDDEIADVFGLNE